MGKIKTIGDLVRGSTDEELAFLFTEAVRTATEHFAKALCVDISDLNWDEMLAAHYRWLTQPKETDDG